MRVGNLHCAFFFFSWVDVSFVPFFASREHEHEDKNEKNTNKTNEAQTGKQEGVEMKPRKEGTMERKKDASPIIFFFVQRMH
jgi:hypothetical protein